MLDFSKNYFELFGLPVAFGLDRAELALRYRELQRIVHPDKYAAASDQERRLSLQGASRVNEAFETLKAPLLRARYMLELHGVDVEAGAANTTDGAFLMEQMEWREELEEAKHQTDPYAALADLMTRIEGRMSKLLDDISERLDAATAESLEEASEILNKLRFLDRLRSQAEELEAALDDAL